MIPPRIPKLQGIHKAAPGEAEALVKAVERAQGDGLAFKFTLDEVLTYAALWLDSATVKAKLGETYAHDGKYGLTFVAPGPFLPDGSYKMAPIKDGEEFVPTLLVVIPRETMGRVRSAPRTQRVETLLDIEAHRVAATFRALGQPLPPEVAQFFEGNDDDKEGA